MTAHALISYDDTLNDHDALALGRLLARAGARLSLTYVRHTALHERSREELEANEAETLLARGARWLGDPETPTHVVLSASTGEGLARLAVEEQADVVVFGSDYRTSPGHVQPGRSAQHLLDGGPAAVAIAPANFRSQREPEIKTIGVLVTGDDTAAQETAWELAERLGAEVVARSTGVDLLVVGSRTEAPESRAMVTSAGAYAIENARCPVLVVARHTPLAFRSAVAAAA